MKLRDRQREDTRRAILDALAKVIIDSGGVGFSVQEVARAAGVTHRTVYNHFPTREALSNGLALHVEEKLSAIRARPDADLSLGRLVPMVGEAYEGFAELEVPVRAYVMLMIASRVPAQVARDRTAAFGALIARDVGIDAPLTPLQLAAAVRMFLSSTGWHLLTEHLGLTQVEAAATASWATRALLDAAQRKQG